MLMNECGYGNKKIGDEAARARCGGDDVIHLHP